MELIARRYDTQQVVRVHVADGRIVRADEHRIDPRGKDYPWVSPGFVDVQINGYGGQEFSSLELTPEKVERIVTDHYAFGVTGLCPTLTTQSIECLSHGMRQIAAACETSDRVRRAVVGIHLEGPYISAEDGPRGAHPLQHCKRPEWDEFCRLQDAAGGRIRILTMSPEFDESADFIARVAGTGVIVAIGHTSADAAHIHAAVDAGARLSTHLGNGAHRLLRRHPNYLWDQMAEDRLVASLIVDGHHLPPEVVKTMVRAKTPQRCILVSDVSGLAGLPPGRYQGSGGELEILPDGRLVLAGQDQLLGGATLPIGVGVSNVVRFAGIDLATAVDMASTDPARLISCACGGLRPGDRADLVLFDWEANTAGPLRVRATITAGKIAYGAL